MVMNLLQQRWGNLPKSFFKGVIICQLDCMFGRVGAAQFGRFQWKDIMVLGQSHQAESANSGGHNFNPLRSRSSNNFPCLCQMVNLGGWGLWGSFPLQQPGLCQQFQHYSCSHCPGHWGFLLESLGVVHTIPYHHNYVFATLPQLGVCILNSENLQERAIFSSQCLGHDINALPHISPLCLHGCNARGKSIHSLDILGDDHFVILICPGLFWDLVIYYCGCSPLCW